MNIEHWRTSKALIYSALGTSVITLFAINFFGHRSSTGMQPFHRALKNAAQDERDLDDQDLPSFSPEDLSQFNAKDHRNLPIDFLLDEKQMSFWRSSKQCGNFPQIHDISIQNIHWQKLYTSNQTVFLLSAFYDNRQSDQPVVQVLVGGKISNRLPSLFCQMWFKDIPNPVEVPMRSAKYLTGDVVYEPPSKELYMGHLVTCPIPKDVQNKVPDVVSMVHKSCQKAINALRVMNRRPKKVQDFAVCVKSLWSPFEERSTDIAEWIEMNLALGIKHIRFYVQAVTPKTRALLNYYERNGIIEVVPMQWPGSYPTSNSPWLQKWYYDNIRYIHSAFDHYAYNDCLYTNLYSYKYLALIDTDEILMPVAKRTWQGLFKQFKREGKNPQKYDFIGFPHFYFFGNKTQDNDYPLRILGSNLRTSHFMGHVWQSKGIFNVKSNNLVFNHHSISCLTNPCRSLNVGLDEGRLNHYRPDCIATNYLPKDKCDLMKANLIEDNLAWRYRDRIEAGVRKALSDVLTTKKK